MTPQAVTPQMLREWALPAAGDSKYARGDVVVVGGAAGTPGAASLAALAALRVGAGRVRVAVAESVAPALAVAFPEAGVIGLPQAASGTIDGGAAAQACAEAVADADSVLLGPGLDDGEEAEVLVRDLVPGLRDDCALVLDAYALGALPACREVLDGHRGPRVLTPNSRELEMLLTGGDHGEDDLLAVSTQYGAAVTCQARVGDGTSRWEVPTGHPGLATAGSGDVLAGLVTGLLARGAAQAQAACWGTHLHATAGERLASQVGRVGFLARELIELVPGLLTELD